jgi:hypothetical protein
MSHSIAVYPFRWAGQTQQDLAGTSRRPVPVTELLALQDEIATRFAAHPDAATWHIRVD